MLIEREAIDRTCHNTWAGGAAAGAAGDPAVCAPLAAYGTRLRGIAFIDDHRASRLVVQLRDELAGAGRAHLLGVHAAGALGCVIRGLANLARGAGERLSNRVRGL